MTPPEPTPVAGSPWGPAAPEETSSAAGSARRLGAYCWAEQQVFAVLGGWVPEVPEAEVKLAVAEHADHAAWRAQRWFELLPTAPPGADALVVAPVGLDGLVGAIAAVVSGPDRTIEKLAVAYRLLLPRLAAAIDAHRSWVSVVAEPTVHRMLALVASDLATDWVAGERILQTLAGPPELAERGRAALATVEGLVVAAGGIVGIASTGAPRPGGGA